MARTIQVIPFSPFPRLAPPMPHADNSTELACVSNPMPRDFQKPSRLAFPQKSRTHGKCLISLILPRLLLLLLLAVVGNLGVHCARLAAACFELVALFHGRGAFNLMGSLSERLSAMPASKLFIVTIIAHGGCRGGVVWERM